MRIWELDGTGIRKGEPVVDATSTSAALEVGGGPWWSAWTREANSSEVVSAAVRTPVASAFDQIESVVPFEVPSALKPPGY